MYSGRGRASFRRMCKQLKTGEAYGILGQSVLIYFVENKEEIYFHSC